MAQSKQSISSITTGSEIIAQYAVGANKNQLCSANRAVYRLENALAGNGITTFFNVIPLDPPCAYQIQTTWAYWNSLPPNPIIAITQLNNVVQAIPGGAVTQLPPVIRSSLSPTTSTASVSFAKNASTDYLDVIINNPAPGTAAQCTQNLEFEVFCNKLF